MMMTWLFQHSRGIKLNKANWITLLALLTIAAILPVYMMSESGRMDQTQEQLRQKELSEAAELYVEFCVTCHGLSGEGIEKMPALNNPAMADADASRIFNKIAHAPHNTAMAAWHVDDGGYLNTYQVSKLVTLIRFADWDQVARLAVSRNVPSPTGPLPDMVEVFASELENKDHQCVACHEEPEVHVDLFGDQCARCHTVDYWSPAYLTLHMFILDHGKNDAKSCESCHVSNYYEYTCYGCHDHVEEEMISVHLGEGISEIDACHDCHPTGVEGEAGRKRDLERNPIVINITKGK
jgi:mono/diheme cytochrome c family protein